MEKEREEKLRGLFQKKIKQQKKLNRSSVWCNGHTVHTHTMTMVEMMITNFPSCCAKHPPKIVHTQHGQSSCLQIVELQRTSHG